MKANRLVAANCKRCGRGVMTARRAISAPLAKGKWGVLCSRCTTDEEKHQIVEDQAEEIMGALRVGR